MKKFLTVAMLAAICMLNTTTAWADYFSEVDYKVMTYDLAPLSIPAAVGGTSAWHDNNSIQTYTDISDGRNAYIDLTVNGTLLGDGVTWATNNAGIGIQYELSTSAALANVMNPSETITAPNYRLNLNGSVQLVYRGYIHLRYRLVRLLEKVPPGKLTVVPDVTLHVYNIDGDGQPSSGLILSGISTYPPIDSCDIDVPAEITLTKLYGNALTTGAQNVIQAPKIKLTNCPGAINGISYEFAAVYGTHNAVNGVLNTVTGEGYAQNVYIQIQNADGTPHKINNTIALSNYDGSGDYAIPDFKVGYYIDNTETVTAGNVKTAIEFKVTYN